MKRMLKHVLLFGSLVLAACAAPSAAPSGGARASDAPPAAPAMAAPQPPASTAPTATPVPVSMKFGLQRTVSLASVFVAQDKGYFLEQGLELEFEILTAGSDIMTQVGAGNLHAGSGSGASLFNGFARGLDIKIIGSTQQNDPAGEAANTIVVRTDLLDSGAVRELRDLRGRKVAVNARGVASEYIVDRLVRQDGITVDDVELVSIPFPDMNAALTNRVIDAAFITEPYLTQAETLGVARRIAPNQPAGEQITVLLINTGFVRANPEADVRFMTAYLRAARELYGEGWNRDDVVTILEKYTLLPGDIIRRSVKPYIDPNGRINLASLEAQQRYFLEHGFLQYRELIPTSVMVDTRVAEEAVRRLGGEFQVGR
jgi:NitT/TauT family transport system substrate-binding protein